ncbi:MAG: acyl-CoA reductase [Solirubrobacteraceae bacterium]
MNLSARIDLLGTLGKLLARFLENPNGSAFGFALQEKIIEAQQKNNWFTQENSMHCLIYWASVLKKDLLEEWIGNYELVERDKTVGIVMAGNIPMVGFHDLLCVFLVGHKALIKTSSKDDVLIPFLINELCELEPKLKSIITFAKKLENFDAVIATGSNNTARYFELYFKKTPSIIRKNRTSLAVLTGNESSDELKELSNDVFSYFGLGCRSVTKVYLPSGYELKKIFEAFYHHNAIQNHHKYANNYTYHKAIYLMNQDNIYDNGFFLLKNDASLFSPISCLFYEEYNNLEELETELIEKADQIQTIVSKKNVLTNTHTLSFGETQQPNLNDYPDRVDVISFLIGLN